MARAGGGGSGRFLIVFPQSSQVRSPLCLVHASMHPRCAGARQPHPSMITSSSGRAVAASPVASSLASVTSSQHTLQTPRGKLSFRDGGSVGAPTAAGPDAEGPDELSPRRLASPTPSQTARAAAHSPRGFAPTRPPSWLFSRRDALTSSVCQLCARVIHTP